MHEEFELKFQLPSDKAPSLRRELVRRGATVVERVDHYFDTALSWRPVAAASGGGWPLGADGEGGDRRARRPLLERAGAPKTRWDVPHQDASSLVACIAAAPLQQVLLDLVEIADLGAPGTTLAEPVRAAWSRVERHVARLHRKVLADARRFDELPLDAQHRARKRLKRLRYLVEFVGGRWPDRPVRTYLSALGPAQDALGAHIDIAMAQQRFMDDARHDPRSYFAAGFLQNELKRTACDAGAALRRLRGAERFWRS